MIELEARLVSVGCFEKDAYKFRNRQSEALAWLLDEVKKKQVLNVKNKVTGMFTPLLSCPAVDAGMQVVAKTNVYEVWVQVQVGVLSTRSASGSPSHT